MSKYFNMAIGIISVYAALATIGWYLTDQELEDKNEYIVKLESNLNYTLQRLIQTQIAAEERELEYQRIDADFENNENKLEEIKEKSNENKNWLLQVIPVDIDNTIPY